MRISNMHQQGPGFTRRPPPDYTQRSVKLRLFIYVAAIILVLAAIERARDPLTWQWLWRLDRSQNEEPLNTRLADQGLRTAHDPTGTFVATSDPKSDSVVSSAAAQLDPVHRAWSQGWQDVLSRLPADEQSLLFETLHVATAHQALSPDKNDTASDLLRRIQRLWNDYQAAAFQSVAELKGDDQTQWVDVLRQVNERFSGDVYPALQSIVDGRPLTEAEELSLRALQTTLVALAQAQVRDDTVAFRPAEREIWFHALARVQNADKGQLRQASGGRVSYLQLHKQPADYRGKFVTVAGTVRLAYRASAPPNYLGVKEYHVYWLHPAGGPDAPIVVYALAAPPGFPRIAERDANQPPRDLHEDVEVTGLFFKRCAYFAKGSTYTAPLVIANVPDWRRPQVAPSTSQPFHHPVELAAAALGALLLAICVTAVLWKRSSRSYRAARKQQAGGFVPLGNLTVGPSPEESIRELERQARSEESV
jgi:hypothetical protein